MLDLNRRKTAALVRPPGWGDRRRMLFAPFKGGSYKAACLATVEVERELETPFHCAAAYGGLIRPHLKAVAAMIGQASGVRQEKTRPDSSRSGWTERTSQPIRRILFIRNETRRTAKKEIHCAIATPRNYTVWDFVIFRGFGCPLRRYRMW
jgi:hypothetical protein